MNILFLTIGRFESIEAHSIYADLLRCFRNHEHEIYAVAPYEKKTGKSTKLISEGNSHILHVQTGDITGDINLFIKGLSQLSLEKLYIKAIKKYFSEVKFDVVLYSTPPITFCKVVEYIKRKDKSFTYLLLKDIFPQNAVDVGMMSKKGIKGLIYRYFRLKEKRLYAISDSIGCMSQANVDYLKKHNPYIAPEKVMVCPNAIEVIDKSIGQEERNKIRIKYGIPLNKVAFIYGGNLGKPQGIDFVIECLKKVKAVEESFFFIVGSGSEYKKIEAFINNEKPHNVKLFNLLPKEDYDKVVSACDIGLIFLDHRFTIPNFPSRLLGYMQAKIPVLACTDNVTDIGKTIVDGGFGWWCESNDSSVFIDTIKNAIIGYQNNDMREKEMAYLIKNYSVESAYKKIIDSFEKHK